MTFEEILDQAIAMLQRRGRLTYSTLKRQFQLDDAALDDLKNELIEGQRLAVDERGNVLVWTGEADVTPASPRPSAQPVTQEVSLSQTTPPPAAPSPPDAERRQLTVLFCDLADSTALAGQLDPEDLREVVRAYQQTSAAVIQRFDGHIAQYLGDGLLVYFGYPQAHEDDAVRAVHAGLEIVEAMHTLNARLEQERGLRLAVRLGIHTGLVVVGEMGGGERHGQLALGETPNLAARLQGLAALDTVVISAATLHLVQGYVVCQDLGVHPLKGVAAPVTVYRVLRPNVAQSRLDVAGARGFTPFVGREAEMALLLERWAQVKEGTGHVVLLHGEAGIGKSRLVQVLKDHTASEAHTRLECRCSPYYQNSALYPLIDLLHRAWRWQESEAPVERLEKLEHALGQYRLALEETVPLLAALLSLPLPDGRYPLLTLTPQRQKQKTLEAILRLVLALAERQPVLFIVEDLHWIDPSTLEFLGLLLEQGPTVRLLTLLTSRLTFQSPWTGRAHITPITLTRLPVAQVEAMVARLTHGKPLPAEVLHHVVANTDGVPLFVEELTKMLLESGLLTEADDRYALAGPLPSLAIPTTLHDSLMARLDRLATVKVVAQLGATLGRQFSYSLLQAVSPLDEPTLQHDLQQLVDAELLYRRGVPPQATYLFKHALIQEAAYQSLLKSTRQQYHQRIAQVLAAQFPETIETQPELLAHHYTGAGLTEQAIPYWQLAGQRALQRSAHLEAVAHLTQGLALLTTLPETPARRQQELDLQVALGPALIATKGHGAPDTERAHARARALCEQLGDTPQLFPVLRGLLSYYVMQGQMQEAHRLGEQMLRQAQAQPDPAPRMLAHFQLGLVLFWRCEPAAAQTHHTQALTLYTPQAHRALAVRYGVDVGVASHCYLAWELWSLGSPEQALQQSQAARTLAQEVAHPYSLATALFWAAVVHQFRRETPAVYALATALTTLAAAQGFALFLAWGALVYGWALALKGQGEQGIAAMRQGLAAELATGSTLFQPYGLGLLAEAYRDGGHPDEGLAVLAEARAVLETTEGRFYAAELSRLQGALLLRQAVPDAPQGEACFHQALAIARQQQAKSWELRAAVSLARLWQQQGKRDEARELLAPLYGWFTEGFDTADLQKAKTLLDALA
jgi:predicted ATPase/class 3 adenylate cyclase